MERSRDYEDEDYYEIINSSDEMISLSSSDSSDVLLLKENQRDTVMISSDSDIEIGGKAFDDGIHLNFQSSRKNSIDDNVSDTCITMQWDWSKVNSPVGWTNAMKRYYNKPCKRQRYFDWKKILSEIRLENRSHWSILKTDLYPIQTKRKNCLICHQSDHLSRACPRQQRICTMCGLVGHKCFSCPEKKCLNCGRGTKEFIKYCGKCRYSNKIKCNGCNKYGHAYENCPDLWRRFHCTVAYQEVNSTPSKLNENIQCCNCAKVGHLYEQCKEVYWSSYSPTSCIVTNYYKDHFSKKQNDNSSVSDSVQNTPETSNKESLKRGYVHEFASTRDKLEVSKRIKLNNANGTIKQTYANPLTYFLSMFANKKKKNKKKKNKKKSSKQESNQEGN